MLIQFHVRKSWSDKITIFVDDYGRATDEIKEQIRHILRERPVQIGSYVYDTYRNDIFELKTVKWRAK